MAAATRSLSFMLSFAVCRLITSATSVLAPVARSTGASYDSQSVRDGERWFPVSPASYRVAA